MNGNMRLGAEPRSVEASIIGILEEIAPEIEGDHIDPSQDLRDQLDIDSIDFLSLMIGIHERYGVDVPEADYGRLTTLDSIASYLRAHGIDSGEVAP